MKNIKIVLVFFGLLLSPMGFVALATSGACSYHSGVNCGYGATSSGKVMCNDGWINSTVYFSDMDECKVVDSCPNVISGLMCTTEADYASVQQQVDNQRSSLRAIYARSGMLGTPADNSATVGQDKLDSCRASINSYNTMVTARNQCLDDNDKQQAEKIKWLEYEQKMKLDGICAKYNGAGSVYDSNKPSTNPCTPDATEKDAMCKKSDPKASYNASISRCVCDQNSVLNEKSLCEDKAEYLDGRFKLVWLKALEIAPEYNGVANYEDMKKEAVKIENKDLTLTQIFRKIYGDISKAVKPTTNEKPISSIASKKTSKSLAVNKEEKMSEVQNQKDTSPIPTPVPTEKKTFGQKLSHFFKRLKFW